MKGMHMVKKLCFVLAARMLLLFGCGGNETAEIDSGNTLSISLNSLTEEPLFVDWE